VVLVPVVVDGVADVVEQRGILEELACHARQTQRVGGAVE